MGYEGPRCAAILEKMLPLLDDIRELSREDAHGADHQRCTASLTFRDVLRPKTSLQAKRVTNHRLVNMLSCTPSSARC